MGAFSYQALDASGKLVKGVIEGDSERQVRGQLRSKALKPIQVEAAAAKKAGGGAPSFSFSGWNRRLSPKDVTLITRQLASLVQSGLPLDEVLQTAAKQSRKPGVKEVVLQVRARVLEGHSLAQALGENPRAFDDMYRSMVRAGESAGFLGPVLERLADYAENSQHTRQRMKMAMIYPMVLMGVAISVIAALMAFVVPKLTGLFRNSNAELPGLTQALIAASDFIINYGLYCVVGLVALGYGVAVLLRDPARRLVWHRIQLKLPLFGELVLQADSARFSATLSILLSSGVPLLEGLRIAGQVMSNTALREASKSVAAAVQEGTSLHRALDQAGIFPPLLVQMAASGEANGTLDKQLEHSANNQERELEMMLGTAMGLLEPLTVVFMGGMVTLIVMAILQPIFELNKLVG
ncbi:type II secretion system protein GspF [Exilibacterium tricleocarpae]|uniref:General secretion pathway protein F n=1 Tax=Exilibacterium tricleocarpae TaxID=2591008 RepID=A0A545TZ77_9GAMM|nr:type II secretion system inner membrane protein GspF [Exilibacterium tricleocarpae]TQV82514.1 type II secretion system protein GspF [Exilibacterium tricleocarpae]